MKTFEYVCLEITSSSKQPLCWFAKTEINQILNVFLQLYEKIDNYGLVIIIRFCL